MIGRRINRSILTLGVAWVAAGPLWAQGEQGRDPAQMFPAPEQKRFEEAAQLLDRLFGQLNKADNEKAANAVEKAIWNLWAQSGSPTADALLQQATKAMNASAHPIALRILDTIIEIKPDFAEAWNKRATIYYLEREFDKSLADIDVVLDLEPRHFGALSGMGMIRRQLGDERGALEAFRRALAIHPHQKGAKRAVKELESELEQKI